MAPGPRVGEPIPPPPWFKENIANGIIPRNWHDSYPKDRCRCGHLSGAHVHVLPLVDRPGSCTVKLCRKRGLCTGFEQDPRFEIPAWSSVPSSTVVTVPTVEVAPGNADH